MLRPTGPLAVHDVARGGSRRGVTVAAATTPCAQRSAHGCCKPRRGHHDYFQAADAGAGAAASPRRAEPARYNHNPCASTCPHTRARAAPAAYDKHKRPHGRMNRHASPALTLFWAHLEAQVHGPWRGCVCERVAPTLLLRFVQRHAGTTPAKAYMYLSNLHAIASSIEVCRGIPVQEPCCREPTHTTPHYGDPPGHRALVFRD